MDIFAVDLTQAEIIFIRQALEAVQISGKDAKFLANLQTKIEQELNSINVMRQQAEQQKLLSLSQTIEATKTTSKK